MARKAKTKIIDKAIPQPVQQPTVGVDIGSNKQSGYAGFVGYKGMDVINYADVAFGQKQKNSSAPISVPPGFVSQVPYTTGTNSTIIQNPAALPVTSYYQAMLTDPVIFSSMFYIITTVISRFGDYMCTDKEAEKLGRDTLKRIGKNKLLQGLLSSLWGGFVAIKLNWDYVDGYTGIKSISVLPQDSIMLAVTPEGELDPDFGVLHYYFNLNSGWNQNPKAYSVNGNGPFASLGSYLTPQRQIAFNPMYLTALPEKWRILHTFNPTGLAGNFYGVSMIQPIWDKLCDKNNMLQKLQVGATFKAAPFVIIETDTQTQIQNPDGTTISQAQNITNKLADGARSGFLVVESLNSLKTTTINNTADLDQNVNTIQFLNNEIRTGLVSADLVGNSGSYANAMANNRSTEVIINNITKHVMDTVMNQLIKPAIDEAMGEIEDYGHFELLDNSLEDKVLWAKVLEGSKNLGVVDPKSLDDVNLIRKKLGYPPVDKLTDDIIYGMMGLMEGNGTPVNMAKAKEDIGMPYSNGMDKEQNDRYGRGMDT